MKLSQYPFSQGEPGSMKAVFAPTDLPRVFHPAVTGVRWSLIRSPTLDRPKAEFSGFAQGDGLVTPPDFVSMIGTLLPIAPCGRSSL